MNENLVTLQNALFIIREHCKNQIKEYGFESCCKKCPLCYSGTTGFDNCILANGTYHNKPSEWEINELAKPKIHKFFG